ncbi:MAG TPA: chlorite dismutase family protein [Acidimicrobiales bacterium]|nr:chlorite dismutase family protein [Acidimicrobiales bacterium]
MPDPIELANGTHVVHLFFDVGEAADSESLVSAVKAAEADGVQVVAVAMIGHKADLGIMALGPDLWRLRRLQSDLQAARVELVDSYVSITEVSEYAKGMPDEALQARLYPVLPPEGKRAFCFYPMSKRRGESHNWYELPYDDRHELMLGHGKTGRTFAGRIVQLITASAGLDDYEWGVTLFGVHADDLKDVVYSMRFDEASARYAEFGRFLTGVVGTIDEVVAELVR